MLTLDRRGLYKDVPGSSGDITADIPGFPNVSNRDDMNLVAAQHYFVARNKVVIGRTSEFQMKLETDVYETDKAIRQAVGLPGPGRLNPETPVSPPSDAVRRWGIAGAKDGERDHMAFNKTTPAPPWISWRELSSWFGIA